MKLTKSDLTDVKIDRKETTGKSLLALKRIMPLVSVLTMFGCVPSSPSPRLIPLDIKSGQEEVQEDTEQTEITFADVKPKDVKDNKDAKVNDSTNEVEEDADQDNRDGWSSDTRTEDEGTTIPEDTGGFIDSSDVASIDVNILDGTGQEDSVSLDSGTDIKQCTLLGELKKPVNYDFKEGITSLPALDDCTNLTLTNFEVDQMLQGSFTITLSQEGQSVQLTLGIGQVAQQEWNGHNYQIQGVAMLGPSTEFWLRLVAIRKE